MEPVPALVAACVTALAVVLLADRAGARGVSAVAKIAASTAFVAVAVAAGGTATAWGRWLLGALALSWLGDLLLVSRAKRAFLAGLAAFLAAHLAFAAAFAVRGLAPAATALAALLLLPVAFLLGRWLLPHVPPRMRPAVAAYVAALVAMTAMAAGVAAGAGPWWLLPAGVAFLASDLAVARDRFVSPGRANRVWGLPLYYGAQLVFAASAGAAP